MTATQRLREMGVVDLAVYRDVALCERGLAGDVDACIEWLSKHWHDPRLRKPKPREYQHATWDPGSQVAPTLAELLGPTLAEMFEATMREPWPDVLQDFDFPTPGS